MQHGKGMVKADDLIKLIRTKDPHSTIMKDNISEIDQQEICAFLLEWFTNDNVDDNNEKINYSENPSSSPSNVIFCNNINPTSQSQCQ